MALVDLSHRVREGMTTYPGLPGPVMHDHLTFEASHDAYAAGTEFSIRGVTMVGNTGTYLDTPAHRWRDGHDLAGLPLERCADLPAVVVDGPPKGPADDAVGAALAVLDPDDVRGSAVLVRTGWSRHFGTERYGSGEHPHLGEAGCRALVEAGAVLVGIDSVNIDDTVGAERPAHSLLLRAGVLVVEHLTGLAALPRAGARFSAVPPMVAGLATFPVRAFAVLPAATG